MLWSDTEAMKRLATRFDRMISTVPRAYPIQPFVDLFTLDATLVDATLVNVVPWITFRA